MLAATLCCGWPSKARSGRSAALPSTAIRFRPATSSGRSLPAAVQVGTVSSAAYSPDYRTNVAIGMVRMTHWDDGTKVQVDTPHGMRSATVWEKSFTDQEA